MLFFTGNTCSFINSSIILSVFCTGTRSYLFNRWWKTCNLHLVKVSMLGCFIWYWYLKINVTCFQCTGNLRLHSFSLIFQGTQAEWRIVFFICSSLYLFGGLFYLVFASGELQPWAAEDTDKKENGKLPVELHENEFQEKLLGEKKEKENEESAVA